MSFDSFDHQCMATALQLAQKGVDTTHPNPRVGCVIAKNGQIVGSGWHQKAGQAHAEVNALRQAGEGAHGATVYVTLEPCSHSGLTPPCTQALVNARVSRVVFAVDDPNPDVNGSGAKFLREAGIEVQSGLMSDEAERLNTGFFKRMRTHLPWVRVKLAQSLDGHISLANGTSQWISSAESRADVQKWRARADVILTGIGTVLADDPSLNVRHVNNARQPAKVVVDSFWRTPVAARMLALPGEVLIAGLDANQLPDDLNNSRANCIFLPQSKGRVDLKALLAELAQRGFNEIQVEAGATLCGAMLHQGLIDELLIYQSPVILGGGAISPFNSPQLDNMDDRVHLEWIDSRRIGKDLRLRLKPVVQVPGIYT